MNGCADDGSDGDSGVGGAGGWGNPYCQLNILNYYIAHSNTAQKLTSPNCIYICKLSNINIILYIPRMFCHFYFIWFVQNFGLQQITIGQLCHGSSIQSCLLKYFIVLETFLVNCPLGSHTILQFTFLLSSYVNCVWPQFIR